MQTPDYPNERRQSQRIRAQVEAELTADVSLLQAQERNSDLRPLVFMGETRNVSQDGLAFILPSLRIAPEYCTGSPPLKLQLHLPATAVAMTVSLVRCEPLQPEDFSEGFLIGARIVSLDNTRQETWENALAHFRK